MIPSVFDYQSPLSVAQAVGLLGERSLVLSGGTWAVPAMNRGEVRPAVVVDLRRLGLDRIGLSGGTVRIGATCTYAGLLASDVVARHLPLLRVMAAGITGGQQILNQGTLGGSVAAARPSSDALAVVVALGGRAVVASADGERRVEARDFFRGPRRTALGDRDLLVALEFPSAAGLRSGYVKLKHGQSSWPIATAAVLLGPVGRRGQADGRGQAVVVLGGLAGTPVVVRGIPADSPVTEAEIADATRQTIDSVADLWTDVLAPAAYRAAVAPVLAARAWRKAAAPAEGTRS
jgi:aerobic carbon-monoxide dehydrogenase medium subunit